MILSTVCLYLTLAACGVLIGLMVVKYDLYQREAWYMILAATGLGAAAMFGAGQAQFAIIDAVHARQREVSNLVMALMAGVTEELAKFVAVAGIALFAARHLDEPVDGIIYGSFVGLGAALEESVYFLGWAEGPTFLPPQEPVRLAGHLIMGGIGGFGIGLLRTRARGGAAATIGAFLGAVALHTVWDVVAFDAADVYRRTGNLGFWHTALPMVFVLGGMVTYRKLIGTGLELTRMQILRRERAAG